MDESVYTSSPAYTVEESGDPTFWDGLTVVALLVYVVAAIVRGFSPTHCRPRISMRAYSGGRRFDAYGWGVAAFVRKWRGVRTSVARS